MKKINLLSCILFILIGCQSKEITDSSSENLSAFNLEEIPLTITNAAEPNLSVGPDGKILLSWIQKQDTVASLNYAILEGNEWKNISKIAEGSNWFVNWADFPSVLAMESGFVAHYLAQLTDDKYSYGVNLVTSTSGMQWAEPVVAHDDGTPTEHGFVTLLPMTSETFMAVWLDGRKYVDQGEQKATKEMSLRSGIFDLNGSKISESVIDPRVCDCCQTDGALTSNGPVVVFRNRSLIEVRDIYISRYENENWIEPWVIHSDNWEIPGCPVNGPAIDASGEKVSVAWFTGANGTRKVMVAFSNNSGDTFNDPVQIDLGNPLGRVDLKQFENFSVVTWMEEKEEKATIYARKIFSDNSFDEPITISETVSARSSGFPRIAKDGNDLILAWTVSGDVSTIQTSRVTLID